MKQKHFFCSLLLFLFFTSHSQNNALQISNDSYFGSFTRSFLFNDYYLNSNSFTIEYDFYLNSSNNYNARFSSFADNGVIAKPIHFYVTNTGTSTLLLGNGTTEESVPGMPTFNTQQWYHIAFVVTNSGTKNVRVYVNGVSTIHYDFTINLDGFDELTKINLGATTYSSSNNTGNAKYDNLRIWSSARTASEIANNYASCLGGNEIELVSYFNFDGYNGSQIKNLATNSPVYTRFNVFNNYSYQTGGGCTVAPLYEPIRVTGDFNAIFYYTGQTNGKPHYKTDPWECTTITTASRCAGTPPISELFWENNQWIIRNVSCAWDSVGEECFSVQYSSVGINLEDTLLPPCEGWTSNVTVYTTHCTTLSTVDQELEETIAIYPNPSTGIFNFSIEEDATVEIYNMLGKKIFSNEVNVGITKIDISNHQAGIYLLHVKSENGSVIKKIIKQ